MQNLLLPVAMRDQLAAFISKIGETRLHGEIAPVIQALASLAPAPAPAEPDKAAKA